MKILACLLAALMACLPISASAITQQEAVNHLKWAGASSNLEVQVRSTTGPNDANGAFMEPGCYVEWFYEFCIDHPTIIIWQGANVPDELIYHVMFHEYTHYLQWRDYGFPGGVYTEWDADAGSADLMCRAGFDGIGAMERWATWLKTKLGYTGDPTHGSYLARLTYARAHAHACEVAPQAP